MSDDLDVIRRIVAAFERSDWTEIDVRAGSLRIHLSTNDDATPPSDDVDATRATGPAATVAAVHDALSGERGGAPDTRLPSDLPAGAHLVVSPSPGIFWRSPQPGAPPFAGVGDRVGPSSTMCIVEVMKLMTHVKSTIAGTVVGVFVDDGTRVDQGDSLFAIAPDP